MADAVLDASALLAYVHGEAGAEAVEEALARVAAIGATNLAEVLSKVAETGADPVEFIRTLQREGLLEQSLEVHQMTLEVAILIARLRPHTKALGLSLGDRACLALGAELGLPILTADREWLNVDGSPLGLDFDIRPIR